MKKSGFSLRIMLLTAVFCAVGALRPGGMSDIVNFIVSTDDSQPASAVNVAALVEPLASRQDVMKPHILAMVERLTELEKNKLETDAEYEEAQAAGNALKDSRKQAIAIVLEDPEALSKEDVIKLSKIPGILEVIDQKFNYFVKKFVPPAERAAKENKVAKIVEIRGFVNQLTIESRIDFLKNKAIPNIVRNKKKFLSSERTDQEKAIAVKRLDALIDERKRELERLEIEQQQIRFKGFGSERQQVSPRTALAPMSPPGAPTRPSGIPGTKPAFTPAPPRGQPSGPGNVRPVPPTAGRPSRPGNLGQAGAR